MAHHQLITLRNSEQNMILKKTLDFNPDKLDNIFQIIFMIIYVRPTCIYF